MNNKTKAPALSHPHEHFGTRFELFCKAENLTEKIDFAEQLAAYNLSRAQKFKRIAIWEGIVSLLLLVLLLWALFRA